VENRKLCALSIDLDEVVLGMIAALIEKVVQTLAVDLDRLNQPRSFMLGFGEPPRPALAKHFEVPIDVLDVLSKQRRPRTTGAAVDVEQSPGVFAPDSNIDSVDAGITTLARSRIELQKPSNRRRVIDPRLRQQSGRSNIYEADGADAVPIDP
jgi:hypothetical protein